MPTDPTTNATINPTIKLYAWLQSRAVAGDRGEVSTEVLYVAGIAVALIGVVAAIQAGLMGRVGEIFGS
jgi:hypothetical protein